MKGERLGGWEGGKVKGERENDGRGKRNEGRWGREENKFRRVEAKKVRRKEGREDERIRENRLNG